MNTKLKAILAFLFIFVAGFATGFLLNSSDSSMPDDQRTERIDQAQNADQVQRGERDDRQAERARNRLINMLELEENQQEPFFEHFSEYRSNIRSEIREIRERENELIKEHYEEFKSGLSNVLNTEQLNRLDRQLHPDSVRHFRSRGNGPGDRRGN
jgi:hypothetical protein